MSQVYAWAISVCICTAICMLVEFLAVNGSMEKILKFILGVFLICCTIMPLQTLVTGITEQLNSININSSINQEFSSDIEKASEDITRESIKQVVAQQLHIIDCTAKNIEIVTKTKDEKVELSEIVITLDKKYKDDFYRIKSSLEETLKLKIKLEV